MSFTPRAIHQFHGSSATGDAITNGLFYTRDLLRSLGFASEIYCEDVAPELLDEIHPAPAFPDSPDTLLLVHFSWAIRFFDWLRSLSCRKILVYHNITPVEFFEEGGLSDQMAQAARRQLAGFRNTVESALTPSAYNARELQSLGYPSVDVLPLLFDPADWLEAPYDLDLARTLDEDEAFHILFVGRIVANKCQEDLLEVVHCLRTTMRRPVRLTLVGGLGAGAEYERRLEDTCERLGLSDCVDFAGKISDEKLRALYRGADVFLCLSEHEGFCVPVLEAMQFDLPVVAFAAGAIPETVGRGGLVLSDKEPATVAATLKILADEPELRRRLVSAGRDNIARFCRNITIQRLALHLQQRLHVASRAPHAVAPRDRQPKWRIEGPFDSSYSLALVNRSLAKALADDEVDVGLHSTEGPGDYPPNEAFLASEPQVVDLWRRGQSMARADIILRNLYPPRVSAMAAPTRVLASWGWEESAIPTRWIDEFNRKLNLVTVVSRFVAKALADNGLRIPVAIVGNGAEHFRAPTTAMRRPAGNKGHFKFLHVSSGFPRKGVDILLEAWGRAFTSTDRVALVLKTFPNAHNEVASQVEALRRRFPDHAEIIHRDEDAEKTAVATLYEQCDALVLPARGEGFGLPAAEAMLEGLPVIATAHGGMLDFCSDRTAWLVDYKFARARTHLNLFNSVWAEPDVDDLTRALREVWLDPDRIRQKRTQTARKLMETVFTWQAVAKRTRTAINSLDAQVAISLLPKVAWVSSWNVQCGIASYSRLLTGEIPIGCLKILASRANALLGTDEPNVARCWNEGRNDDLEELFSAIVASSATRVVIQFNFGFFDLKAFGRLLDRLAGAGVACHVILHSTLDVEMPERRISLGEIRENLSRVSRLLVHSIADLNRLKDFGLVNNVSLFPHGAIMPANGSKGDQPLPRPAEKVIACFGYMLPHKGIRTLIQAFGRLQVRRPDLRLLLLNALYPVPDSQSEAEACQQLIRSQPASSAITLVLDYMPEDEILARLLTADLIVFPYQHSQESASGAIRFALSTGRPVACTPLPIFEDVAEIVHQLPGTSVDDLEAGIAALLAAPEHLSAGATRQAAWLAAHDWRALSTRLWNMLRASPPLDLVAADMDDSAHRSLSPQHQPMRP